MRKDEGSHIIMSRTADATHLEQAYERAIRSVEKSVARGKLTTREGRLLGTALDEAMTCDPGSFHIGCVIALRGVPMSTGHSEPKTNPAQRRYNLLARGFSPERIGKSVPGEPVSPFRGHTLHAEMSALLAIPRRRWENVDLSRAVAYVARISPGHETGHGMARPCGACMRALIDAGIREVIYTTGDGIAREDIDVEKVLQRDADIHERVLMSEEEEGLTLRLNVPLR